MIKINYNSQALCKVIMTCEKCRELFKKKEKECLIAKDNTGELAISLIEKRNKQETNQNKITWWLYD